MCSNIIQKEAKHGSKIVQKSIQRSNQQSTHFLMSVGSPGVPARTVHLRSAAEGATPYDRTLCLHSYINLCPFLLKWPDMSLKVRGRTLRFAGVNGAFRPRRRPQKATSSAVEAATPGGHPGSSKLFNNIWNSNMIIFTDLAT